jgi:hypothetical protein
MINLKDFIFTVDDILTDDECDFIIDEFGKNKIYNEDCFESNTTEMRQSTVKITSLMPNTEAFNLVHNATDHLIYEYSQYLKEFDFIWLDGMIAHFTHSHNYRLMKYSEGQSIHDHVDKGTDTFGSATLSLNDGYEGGLFRFFRGKHKVRTKKKQGMIFPAEHYFVHGVEPITEDVRWSVNSFLGIEPGVIEDNKNTYGSDFWYHESARPYHEKLEQSYSKFYGSN